MTTDHTLERSDLASVVATLRKKHVPRYPTPFIVQFCHVDPFQGVCIACIEPGSKDEDGDYSFKECPCDVIKALDVMSPQGEQEVSKWDKALKAISTGDEETLRHLYDMDAEVHALMFVGKRLLGDAPGCKLDGDGYCSTHTSWRCFPHRGEVAGVVASTPNACEWGIVNCNYEGLHHHREIPSATTGLTKDDFEKLILAEMKKYGAGDVCNADGSGVGSDVNLFDATAIFALRDLLLKVRA